MKIAAKTVIGIDHVITDLAGSEESSVGEAEEGKRERLAKRLALASRNGRRGFSIARRLV